MSIVFVVIICKAKGCKEWCEVVGGVKVEPLLNPWAVDFISIMEIISRGFVLDK